VYVEYVTNNPMTKPGEPITSDLFKSKLDGFVKQSSIFGNIEMMFVKK
jgi:hypothetical protein